jgi:hypothetical protein
MRKAEYVSEIRIAATTYSELRAAKLRLLGEGVFVVSHLPSDENLLNGGLIKPRLSIGTNKNPEYKRESNDLEDLVRSLGFTSVDPMNYTLALLLCELNMAVERGLDSPAVVDRLKRHLKDKFRRAILEDKWIPNLYALMEGYSIQTSKQMPGFKVVDAGEQDLPLNEERLRAFRTVGIDFLASRGLTPSDLDLTKRQRDSLESSVTQTSTERLEQRFAHLRK